MIIKDKDYKVKSTLRSYIYFEEITHKPFELNTTLDKCIYLYCVLIANNDIELTFDDFVIWLDDDNTLMASMFEEINKGHEQPKDKKKELVNE